MVLVDSSVWIDHFKHANAELSALLESRVVLCHPFVLGKLACGFLSQREIVPAALAGLPSVPLVAHADVLAFVARYRLMGRGIGRIDVHLLASAIVAGRVWLWCHDKRLAAAACERGVAYLRPVH